MKISLVFASALVVGSVVGCSKPSPEEQKKQEEKLAAALTSALAMPATPTPPAAATPLTLETKTHDKLGAKISMPQGAKLVSDNAIGTSYSYDLGSLEEIGITLSSALGVTNMKSALQDVAMEGVEFEVKKEVDKTTFQIVKAPQSGQVYAYQFKKLKTGWVKATCNGPVAYKDKIVEACGSLAAK